MKLSAPVIVVLLDSARSAEPPHSSGITSARAARTLPEAARVARPYSSAGNVGNASANPAVEQGGALGVGGPPVVVRLRPLGLRLPAALDDLPGTGEDGVLDREGLLGVEAEQRL